MERGEDGLEADGVEGRVCGEKVIWGGAGGERDVEVVI